jgi:hypothetical protein
MQVVLRPLRDWERRRALRVARAAADAELIDARLPSPRLAWRTEELVSESHRLAVGRELAAVVHAADERLLPGSSPLDRGAVREARAVLLELASRLFDLDRTVLPRGVLLAEQLLTDSRSPLFTHHATDAMRERAGEALHALDRVGDRGDSRDART